MLPMVIKYAAYLYGAAFVCFLVREIAREWFMQRCNERLHKEREEKEMELIAEYTAALADLNEGRPSRMKRLAQQGVVDAWVELARWLDRQPSPDAAIQATAAYGHAVSAHTRLWKAAVGNTYDQRRLLGIGHEPDYAALITEWRGDTSNYWVREGREREFELAWLYIHAPPPIHDPAEAYRFLCLGRARWGEDGRGWQLNGSTTALDEMNIWLDGVLDIAERERIEREAKRQSYDEFVATR